MESVLQIRDVYRRYGETEALRGISLDVQAGEMFGLLGPNGAGKTTLLSILACLLDASSGSVSVFGKPLNRSDHSLRPLIGLATQDLSLYGELTARENLRFFGSLYGMRGRELESRVAEILEFTALADRADERVARFSGGMKRRLNLGVAVVHRPRLLLLDEPTTGVDPQSRHHLFEEIRSLNSSGTTVIYTSHYMEEVQSLCPRIAIIDHGRVIACDLRERLLQLLPGQISFRVPHDADRVADRFRQNGRQEKVTCDGNTVRIETRDLQRTTLDVISGLRAMELDLLSLDTREPNLEQVFLHLTHEAVRDT